MPTAFQISQGRQVPLSTGLYMALLTYTPALSALDVRTSSDDKFMSLRVISLPSSAFANLGEGFEYSEGEMEIVEFACSLIGGLIRVEMISAAKWDKAHAAVGYTWADLQTMLKFKADALNIEKQLFYGYSLNDPKGFPGFRDMTPKIAGNYINLTDAVDKYAFRNSVVNVGGSTSNTASSIFSVVMGEMDVQLVLGNDTGGELVQIGQPFPQMMAPDPTNFPSKFLQNLVQQLHGFIGLSVMGFNQQLASQAIPIQYSLRRAVNVTPDSGCGNTDIVMDKLARSHGPEKRPSIFFMTARSGEQLAKSRAATQVNFVMGVSGDAKNATYSIQPPPPDNWQGIPIKYPNPNSLGNADAIE